MPRGDEQEISGYDVNDSTRLNETCSNTVQQWGQSENLSLRSFNICVQFFFYFFKHIAPVLGVRFLIAKAKG